MKNKIRALIRRNDRYGGETTGETAKAGLQCFVCALPEAQRLAVDEALGSGEGSLGSIARSVGTSKASVWRHAKNHLLPQVKKELLEALPEVSVTDTALISTDSDQPVRDLRNLKARDEVPLLYHKARRLLERAESGSNYQATKWFIGESRQLLELQARLTGEIHENEATAHSTVLVVIPASMAPAQPDAKQIDESMVIDLVPE